MRYPLLVLAIALTAGTTKARADLVTYNMTGTITEAQRYPSSLPFAVGDHISWTVQYDSSAPLTDSGSGWNKYSWSGIAISNIVDQTTGYHFPSYAFTNKGASLVSWVQLGNKYPGSDPSLNANSIQIVSGGDSESATTGWGAGGATLSLKVLGPLPTLNLADFQLNKLPIVLRNEGYSMFQYGYDAYSGADYLGPNFFASVDTIPGVSYTPEPGSLTLVLLGAPGLAARGLRRRLRSLARFIPCRCRPLLTH
jgi:hypothetical protein